MSESGVGVSEGKLWGWDCKCGGLPIPVTPVTEYQKLKSDYDALKKENEELSTSESEYQKVCEFIAKNFGDLSCCYDAEDVIGLAQSAVDRLKSKLEKAEDVISFYADINNWDDRILLNITDTSPDHKSSYTGGRRAREYLKGEG